MEYQLSQTQVALLFKYAPDGKFDPVVESARETIRRRWETDSHASERKIQQIKDADAYEFDQIGWQIVPDGDGYAMAVVTPVGPEHDDCGPYDLDEITRQFVFDFREKTIELLSEIAWSTGLRPRVFIAAMLQPEIERGSDEFQDVTECLGYTPTGLIETLNAADREVQQATNLYELAHNEYSFN